MAAWDGKAVDQQHQHQQQQHRDKTAPSSSSSSPVLAGGSTAPIIPRKRKLLQLSCSFCERTFNKTEHLERHERSHTKDKPFKCDSCDRLFNRHDSMLRHLRMHQRGPTAGGSSSRDNDDPPQISPSRQSGPLAPLPQTDAAWANSFAAFQRTSTPPIAAASAPPPPPPPTSIVPPIPLPSQQLAPPSHGPTHPLGQGFIGGGGVQFPPQPMATPMPTAAMSLVDGTDNTTDLWQLLYNDLLPGSDSLHTSPHFLDSIGLGSDLFFANQKPQAQVLAPATSYPPPPIEPMHGSSVLPPVRLPDQPLLPSTPLRAQATSLERKPSREVEHDPGRSQAAIREVRSLVADLSNKVTTAVSPLSAQWLDQCYGLYWQRFHPTCPILHRPTFNVRTTCAPLLLNMIAIGSLCLRGPEDHSKGVALWQLVHKSVAGSWDDLLELQGPDDPCKGTQLLLTAVLGQLFAMMSNNRDLTQTSVVFQGLGFRWAKLGGMLERDILDPAGAFSGHTSLDQLWHRWAAREVQKRALLSHYILDGTLSQLFDAPSTVRHTLNPVFTGADLMLFHIDNAEAWAADLRSPRQAPMQPFARLFQDLIAPEVGSWPPPQIPLSILNPLTLLEGLRILLMEWDESEQRAIGVLDMNSIALAIERLYSLLPGDSPDSVHLLARWHSLCIRACQICAKGLSPVASLPVLATRFGRRALLHAVALRQIAEQLPLASSSMPHFTLPLSLHSGATILADLCTQAQNTVGLERCSLEEEIRWPELGGLGLNPDAGFPEDQLATFPAYFRFVALGGIPTLNGAALGRHDLYPFSTALSVFGNTWPVSRALGEDILGKTHLDFPNRYGYAT